MVKKFASLILSFLLIMSLMITPVNPFSVSALTADKTYYTERGTTERFTSATSDDFTAKITELEAAGYEEYSTNTITMNGKSQKLGSDNLFAVYLSADKTELKHIAFYPITKTLHVTTQALTENDVLAAASEPEYTNACEPLFIQIMPDETDISGGTSGMAYAMRLRDGRFIMVDGGMEVGSNTIQAENLYNTLSEYNILDEITVAAWIFTHAHSDHISAFTSFVNKYSEEVNIEQLIYNYPSDDDTLQETDMVDDLAEGGYIYEQRKAIAEKLPDVKISTPYGGDVYKFPGVELEFYLTPTDMFPVMCYQGQDFNTSSMIFKIKAEGQEILITGDSSDYAILNVALPRFGTALSSDMVQMVHHGITFGTGEMYELIGAETVFWPIISGRVSTIVKQDQNMGVINAPSTKEIILSSLGTRTITLPYTPEERSGLFVTPDGYLADSSIYEKAGVSKYGDILDEDNHPWSRTSNSYPLSNGGTYMTWGSVKQYSGVTNESDSAIYFNTSSSTVYTPVYGLEPNTTYTLAFDYMAASSTVKTSGIFPKFGISGTNEDNATLSYNIYQGKSITVNPNEVCGSDNGWNHIEVSFITDSTVYDEYYLSFYANVGAVGSSYKGYIDNISIKESKKTYYYHSNDYEEITADTEWLGRGANLTMSATDSTDEAINGTSLKITSEHSGYVGTAITDVVVPAKTNARVSFNYKVVSGTKGWGKVGYVGLNSTTLTYNWANINNESYTVAPVSMAKEEASSEVKSFVGTIEKKDTTSGFMGFFWQNSEATTIVVDDLKVAEIIGDVKAVSTDENGGTVEVQNTLGTKYTDFAVNETAVFTATPNEGYYFDGWYDESGVLVSGEEVYELKLTTDTELTASFKKGYKQDFENYTLTSREYYGGFSIVEETTDGVASGNKVMEFDASRATDTATSKNRFIINPKSDDLKICEYAALGEKVTLSFKYKVGEGDKVRLYFYTGNTRTNAAAHVKSYGSVDLTETGGWQEYSKTFTLDYSQEKSQISLEIFAGHAVSGTTPATIMIDDVTITKEDYTESFENLGNAIRTSGKQALRFKYAVDKSVLDTTAAGYKVTEYGFIAAKTEDLSDVPTLESENVKIAPAYISDYEGNVTKDIVFSEDDSTKQIYVALYNIGVRSDGSTDYNDYDKDFSVRFYMIFENADGEKVTLYGDTYEASVFATVNAIFDSEDYSEEAVTDKEEIKQFIQSKEALLEVYKTLYPEYI